MVGIVGKENSPTYHLSAPFLPGMAKVEANTSVVLYGTLVSVWGNDHFSLHGPSMSIEEILFFSDRLRILIQ